MKKIQENKKYILILVVILILIVISFSFSFFGEMIFEAADSKAGIGGNFSEKLIFDNGDGINISATLENFANGSGSLRDETISTATLIPDSQIGESLKRYSVSYNITENNFEYSVNSETPELLLKIINPSGQEITYLEGFNYYTIIDAHTGETLTGFDITEFTGSIVIKDDFIIATSDFETLIHEWDVSVTFVNLSTSQNINFGKSFLGEFTFEKINSEPLLLYSNFANKIIDDNGSLINILTKSNPDFSQASTTNEGMYSLEDNDGISLYFRGAVDNNWVYFADLYWRIVRINGDGSVRLVLSGETVPTESTKVFRVGSGYIQNSRYNGGGAASQTFEFSGFMYTLGEHRGFDISSDSKLTLDNWFENNLLLYESYLADNTFCNDRSMTTGTGVGSASSTPEAYTRLIEHKPSLFCNNKLDNFTVGDSGNGMLTYPIGLLTVDEFMLAGAVSDISNNKFYLYNNSKTWSMSPGLMSYYYFHIMLTQSGVLNGHYVSYQTAHDSAGHVPVINLNGDANFSGTGSWNDPYTL